MTESQVKTSNAKISEALELLNEAAQEKKDELKGLMSNKYSHIREAMSTGVGSDTQKPFAIVVVAGLVSRLLLGVFVNPVLYELVASEGDVLQV